MPLEQIERTHASDTALRYRYRDGGGELGIIASVTKPFCGNCTRMRLSPEGQMYTCLFATKGTDLRTLLRNGSTDDEIAAFIGGTWNARDDRYSEQRSNGTDGRDKIEMYYIGG